MMSIHAHAPRSKRSISPCERAWKTLLATLTGAIALFGLESRARACTSSAECDEGDPCAIYACTRGTCTRSFHPTGFACDTNTNICDGTGTCNSAHTCVIGTPPAPGTSCTDDGNVCNGSETCNDRRACVHGTNASTSTQCGSAHDACQSHDHCDGAGTCTAGAFEPVGFGCDDGNICNGSDTCNSSHVCVHSGNAGIFTLCGSDHGSCRSHDHCSGTGTCAAGGATLPQGSECTDGNACTTGDVCDGSGTCAGAPISVDDGNPCTSDGCNPSTGAIAHTPLVSGFSCDDHLTCNGADACNGSGTCVHSGAPAPGAACNDVESCSVAGTCQGGHCAANPANLDDGNPCTVDTCSGVVERTPIHHDAALPGAACTPAGTCSAPGVCDDNERCLGGDPSSTDGRACTATGACTGATICQGGTCSQFAAGSAGDDGNVATLDVCSPGGQIEHVPDASLCAKPKLDRTIATTPLASTRYLFACGIQTGADESRVSDVTLVSSLKGRVEASAGVGLANVQVAVVGHPELGVVRTDGNGAFEMAVNGGPLTLRYTYSDSGSTYLPIERTLSVRSHAYEQAPTVTLTKLNPGTQLVTGGSGLQAIAGTTVTDQSGTRTPLVLFNPATTITAGGTVLSGPLHLGITEYTVGDEGPSRMPGSLPPTSGYTHAVEINLQEVTDPETTVTFDPDHPLVYYLENFLQFPAGSVVPVGSYDRVAHRWVPEKNGFVLTIMSVDASHHAHVDIDGDGQEDAGTTLTNIGITGDETLQLGLRYPSSRPTSLWRVTIPHLTPWDCNWGTAPPDDGTPPPEEPPAPRDKTPCESEGAGSIIGCQSRTLGEALPLAGLPFDLVYASDRSPAWKGRNTVNLLLYGGETAPPSDLLRIEVSGTVGGRTFGTTVASSQLSPSNSAYNFTWDGTDDQGREVEGAQIARGEVRYVYAARYSQPSDNPQAFADSQPSGVTVGLQREGAEAYFKRPFEVSLGVQNALADGLGGWMLSNHHRLDPDSGILWMGDGGRLDERYIADQISTVSTGRFAEPGDPAVDAAAITVGPDGSVYLQDGVSLYRLDPSGTATAITSVAESSYLQPASGLAADAGVGSVCGLAFGPDGSLYLAEQDAPVERGHATTATTADVRRIRFVGASPTIELVAGRGAVTTLSDGMDATTASFSGCRGLAVAPDGTIYLGDAGPQPDGAGGAGGSTSTSRPGFVRRIDASGHLRSFAGSLTTPSFTNMAGLALGPDGSVLVADTGVDTFARVERVWPDGRQAVVLGGGTTDAPADDGVAGRVARFIELDGIAVAPNGDVLLSGSGVTPGGLGDPQYYLYRAEGVFEAADPSDDSSTIHLLAGTGAEPQHCGVGTHDCPLAVGGALAMPVSPTALAVAPDGGILFVDFWRSVLSRVGGVMPGLATGLQSVADADGSQVYVFAGDGRHLDTVDPNVLVDAPQPSLCGGTAPGLPAHTGVRLYEFCYSLDATSGANRLTSIYDREGRPTSIAYSSGQVTITSPDGITSTLTLDALGRMTGLTDAEMHASSFTYNGSSALLDSYTDNDGNEHHFDYNDDGTLLHDYQPAPTHGSVATYKLLSRAETAAGWTTTVTEPNPTKANPSATQQTKHQVAFDDTSETYTTVSPDGSSWTSIVKHDGSSTSNDPDGTVTTTTAAADPRFGVQVTYPSEVDTAVGVLDFSGTTTTKTRKVFTTRSVDVPGGAWTTFTEEVRVGSTSAQPFVTTFTRATATTPATWTTQSPGGRTSTVTLDALGRRSGAVTTGLAGLAWGYGASGAELGKITSIARTIDDPENPGHPTQVRGTTLAHTTAAHGYLSSITNALGQVTSFDSVDKLGEILDLTRPDGSTVTSGFDADGNVTSVMLTGTTSSGAGGSTSATHGFTPDELDGLGSYVAPAVAGSTLATRTTTFEHDADQRPSKVTRADGQTVQIDYDTAGRPWHVTMNGASTPQISLVYQPTGARRLWSVTGPGSTTGLTLAYSGPLPASATWSGPVAQSVAWTYDDELRPWKERVSGTLASGSAVPDIVFLYDADEVLTNAGDLTVARDPGNALLTEADLGSVAETYTANAFGELATITSKHAATTLYSLDVSARDDLGRITTKTETTASGTKSWTYTHDSRGRLLTATSGGVTQTYVYDYNGNRVSNDNGATTIAHYDAQDRVVDFAGATYLHNDAGERTSRTKAAVVTTYTHDAMGHLTGVSNATIGVTYTLDGMGRRIARANHGTTTDGWTYRNALQIAAVYDSAGAFQWRFVYGTGRFTPDYAIGKDGVAYRIITDQLGSVRLVVNASTGAIVQTMEYDPWGKVTTDTSSLPAGLAKIPLGFAGGLYDRDTGLVHFGAREYDPEIGRWVEKDPSHFRGGANFYEYASDDPVNLVDRDGREPNDGPGTQLIPMDQGPEVRDAAMQGAAIGAGIGVGVAVAALAWEALPGLLLRAGLIDGAGELAIGAGAAGSAGYTFAQNGPRSGLAHVLAKHQYGCGPAGASKFLPGMGAKEITELLAKAGSMNFTSVEEDGMYRIEVMFPEAIGTDPTGELTNTLRIIANEAHEVVTMYPVAQ